MICQELRSVPFRLPTKSIDPRSDLFPLVGFCGRIPGTYGAAVAAAGGIAGIGAGGVGNGPMRFESNAMLS
jgi:hypothetical protein